MISFYDWTIFSLVALGVVLTPGPNMIYLLTRSILQGRRAAIISLLGVVLGFVVYMLCAAFGLTALLIAFPFVYHTLQWAGAAYLLYLAWNAVKPGAAAALTPRAGLPFDSPRRLFTMGLVTNLLNPKIAVLYLSLLPQFIDPARGNVLGQSLTLGLTQIVISFGVNLAIILVAGSLARRLSVCPTWLRAHRWIMGGMLSALAVRLVLERRPA